MLNLLRAQPLGRTLLPRKERLVLDRDLDHLDLREYLLVGTGVQIDQFEAYATRWTDSDGDKAPIAPSIR